MFTKWFGNNKTQYGHIVRNCDGQMIGKLNNDTFLELMYNFENDFKINKSGGSYIFITEPNGFIGVGHSSTVKLYILNGYSIDASLVKM